MHSQHVDCTGLRTVKTYYTSNQHSLQKPVAVVTAFNASFAMPAFPAKGHILFVVQIHLPLSSPCCPVANSG